MVILGLCSDDCSSNDNDAFVVSLEKRLLDSEIITMITRRNSGLPCSV